MWHSATNSLLAREVEDQRAFGIATVSCRDACDVPKLVLIIEALLALTKELASETSDVVGTASAPKL